MGRGRNIAIYGAGGFGREVLELIRDINAQFHQYNFIGFFDDGIEKRKIIDNYPILGGIEELNAWNDELALVVAIGSPKTKKSIVKNIRNSNIDYPALIHPNVIIGNENVEIERGCIICAGNIITANVKVGNFTILNLDCTVGHDTNIGKYSSFMPSVNISGEVNIGEAVYMGTGAKIINQLEIGKETIVGAGAVVTKSLPEKCTAVGVPARVIKFQK